MKLSTITIKGFRNFKKATINLNRKTLVIGANDIGKTNLLWAIRLLLDRGLSDYDIEPKDSDFYALKETNKFEILLQFTEVTDDCVVSKMKGKISDDNMLWLKYEGIRDGVTKAKSYHLYAGKAVADLEEIEDRYYRKVLNVKYISSRRDFHNYINREKNYLFQIAKENREEHEVSSDNKLYAEIKGELENVDKKIPKLNYIASATNTINEELKKLSFHHQKQRVIFDATSSDADSFIKNVSIASKNNDESVKIGGDGRLNQIYLALWASRHGLTEENLSEVTIFCIEEPEAHLHPHQQRKLANYLNSVLNGQVVLTSHSPQITSEFSPNSIVRLLHKKGSTKAASKGCSEIIDKAFIDFGYRQSIIASEAFFADIVLLIEGPSEELFYKTLASKIDVDLDNLNISILMVDGVGFDTYIKVLDSLEIPWVLRTDNDIFKIPKKEAYRFAGVERCVQYYRNYFNSDEETDKILIENESHLRWLDKREPEQQNIDSANKIIEELEEYGMFISSVDLENDLLEGPLKSKVKEYYADLEEKEIIAAMQKRKATFMYDFLRKKQNELSLLKGDRIAKPLLECKDLLEANQDDSN